MTKGKQAEKVLEHGGEWITINGTHVLISPDGEIMQGYDGAIGKNIKDIAPQKEEPKNNKATGADKQGEEFKLNTK